ncbi:MAG: hypothetical protein ACRC41_09560 [Sarcina sp.]
MSNFEEYVDINENVSLEEFGRFVAINDKKSKVTNMIALRKMKNAGIDHKTHLLELKKLDDDYRNYVRSGNCDEQILYEKRLAVINKINELEKLLYTLPL